MIVPAMFFSHSAAYMAASPILYEESMGLRPEQYGFVIMVTAVFYLVGNVLNTFLLKTHEEADLVKAGLWVSLFGAFLLLGLALLGLATLWAVALPFFITYLAAGIVFANCVTLALRPFPQRAGAASALLGCLQILMGCVSSALMAWFSHGTQMPLAIYLACCMAVAFVAVRWVVAGSTPDGDTASAR
jgi:MFS family permease